MDKESEMFYVYVYFHPVTKVPFYVGKGKENRDLYHYHNRNNHYNKSIQNILQHIEANSQQPIIKRVFEHVDEQTVLDEETRLVSLYGRLDLGTGSLCNRTPGGDGFGRAGRGWSNEERAKHMASRNAKPQGVGFDQYDINGNFMRTFSNAKDLKEAGYTKTQIMAIRRCCKGERFSVSDLRWSYKNEPLVCHHTTHKTLTQLTKDGTEIAQFVSVSQASKVTGINAGDIASVARGNTKMKAAGGFLWKYTL